MKRMMFVTVWGVTLTCHSVLAQNGSREQPKEDPGPLTQVKSRVQFSVYARSHWGEVVKIAEKEIHVRCANTMDETPKVRVFLPIDVLTNGGVSEDATDATAYRWQDIQKGDQVHVRIVHDDGENVDYCAGIQLERRPGGKIPKSQKPNKHGVPYHLAANVVNDIDNGLDVSDDDIIKAFPFERDPLGPYRAVKPHNLSDDYRIKLEAIREKKDKELKAKPVINKK
jgi:hypothetical protein